MGNSADKQHDITQLEKDYLMLVEKGDTWAMHNLAIY